MPNDTDTQSYAYPKIQIPKILKPKDTDTQYLWLFQTPWGRGFAYRCVTLVMFGCHQGEPTVVVVPNTLGDRFC